MIRKPARSLSVLIAGLSAFATFTLAAGPAGATSPPPLAPRFTSTPPPVTSSTTATFTYDLGNVFGICRLDGASVSDCDGSTSLSGLAAGSHTFEVWATTLETTSAASAYTWTVDLTAPNSTITSRVDPAGKLRLTFSSSERGSTFQCKLVRVGRWVRCESVITIAVGDLPIEVRAIDRAGNIDPTPASMTTAPRR